MAGSSKGDEFIRKNRMIILASLRSHARLMDDHLMRLSMEIPEGETKERADALYEHYKNIGMMAKEADSWIEENYPDETSFEDKMKLLASYELIYGNDENQNSES